MVDSSMFARGWPESRWATPLVLLGTVIVVSIIGWRIKCGMDAAHTAGICEGRSGKIVDGVCCKVTPLDKAP